jgi:hypothetical protein
MAKIHIDKWKNYNKQEIAPPGTVFSVENPIPLKSRGLGDTIEKFTTATGIKKAVEFISEVTGEDCGCSKRKEALNNPNLLVNKIFYDSGKGVY